MGVTRVENGAVGLWPLLSFFLTLPPLKPQLAKLGCLWAGYLYAEVTGGLVTSSWCLPEDLCWLTVAGVGWGMINRREYSSG